MAGEIIRLPASLDGRGRYQRPNSSGLTNREYKARERARRKDEQTYRATRTMRVLAVSDIHGFIANVDALCRLEPGPFDLVIVAGDIVDPDGTLLARLRTFGPVLYVLGNWDHAPSSARDHGPEYHRLHCRPYELGEVTFVGLDWYDQADRPQLAALVAERGASNCIVVTHERLTRTAEDMPGVPLFLFGHLHAFRDTTSSGSRFVQIGALGEYHTVAPDQATKPRGRPNYRSAGFGSYVILDFVAGQPIEVTRRTFHQEHAGWTVVSSMWPPPPPLDTSFVVDG